MLNTSPIQNAVQSPAQGTLWLSCEKTFSMGLVLITTLILARHLGPEAFGTLNYLIAIVALLSPFAAMGLNSIVTRELLLRPEQSSQILGSALALRFGGAVIASLTVALLSPLFIEPKFYLAFNLLLIANIFTALLVFDYWLQAYSANKYAVIARCSVLLFITLLRLLGVYFDAQLHFFVMLAALELMLTGLFFLGVFKLKGAAITSLKASVKEAKQLITQSWWLMLSGIAAIVYLKVDQVMLGQLSSSEQVGIYAVASRLSEVWYFFPVAIVTAFFPKLIKAKNENTEIYTKQLQKLNDFLFLLAFLLAVLVWFIGEPIILLLFGEPYKASAYILTIHIWGGVFIFMRALLSKWLIAENLLQFSLVTQVAGALLNVIINALLIPDYGAVGAAIATVISYAAASYLALFLHSKTWAMAKIMTFSFLIPLRFLCKGKSLYK